MNISRALADKILKETLSVEELVTMLKKYNLLGMLPAILRTVKIAHAAQIKKDTLVIETPFPLSDSSIRKIITNIDQKSNQHTVIINKNLLAGFRARFREKVYDGSAERIIKQLTNNY